MSKSKGITRVDQPSTRTHGYVVRVGWKKTRKGWRPYVQTFFADKEHNGKRTALYWARAWRDAAQRAYEHERNRKGVTR